MAEGRAIQRTDDKACGNSALSGEDSLAAAAVDRFCLSLGSVAGDIALAQGGFAGVVIAGGLGLRIKDMLLRSGFAERFRAKGRFEGIDGRPAGQAHHPSATRPVRRRGGFRHWSTHEAHRSHHAHRAGHSGAGDRRRRPCRPIAEALVAGGLRVLEVTLRTAAALDVIREMKKG
jgi:hypothetical protein